MKDVLIFLGCLVAMPLIILFGAELGLGWAHVFAWVLG